MGGWLTDAYSLTGAGIVERRKTRYFETSPPASGAATPSLAAAGTRPVVAHRHTKGPLARGATPVVPGTPIVEEPNETQPLLKK